MSVTLQNITLNGAAGSYVNLGKTGAFDNTLYNMFIETYIYIKARPPAGKRAVIIMRVDPADSANPPTTDDWALRLQSDGSLSFYFTNPSNNAFGRTSAAYLSSGRWYHIAVTVSPAGYIYLSIDGNFNASTSTGNIPRYTSSSSIVVGMAAQVSDWTWPNMDIRDIRIVKGGQPPTGGGFTPQNAPFDLGAPSYVPYGSTTVFCYQLQFYKPIRMTGTSLFSQLSPAAQSSAVGAFSLRAVNGVTAKAVNVGIPPYGTLPPSPMSTFSQTLTGDPFSGIYTVSASTQFGGLREPWRCFDKTYTGTYYWLSATKYNGTGVYTGSESTTISGSPYTGEWVQILMPTPIVVVSYTIYPSSDYLPAAPKNFKLAGSNDGSTWFLIDTQTSITSWVNSTTGLTLTPSSQSNAYIYFRLCVNATVAYSILSIGELMIYGFGPSLPRTASQDFYADRLGNLLTAPVTGQTLSSWLGGATGYVATWYDQSGKGNDASQATLANQPTITSGAINFDGSTQSFSNASTSGGCLAACVGTGTKYTYTATWNKTSASGVAARIFEHNAQTQTNNQCAALAVGTSGNYGFSGEGNDSVNILGYTVGAQTPVVMRVDNTLSTTNIRVRSGAGASTGTTNSPIPSTLSLNNYQFAIGRKSTTNSEFFAGTMKNVFVFKDAISDSDTAIIDAWQQSI